nr:hypothetical protein [Tanacetum cinerariifolium]
VRVFPSSKFCEIVFKSFDIAVMRNSSVVFWWSWVSWLRMPAVVLSCRFLLGFGVGAFIG